MHFFWCTWSMRPIFSGFLVAYSTLFLWVILILIYYFVSCVYFCGIFIIPGYVTCVFLIIARILVTLKNFWNGMRLICTEARNPALDRCNNMAGLKYFGVITILPLKSSNSGKNITQLNTHKNQFKKVRVSCFLENKETENKLHKCTNEGLPSVNRHASSRLV